MSGGRKSGRAGGTALPPGPGRGSWPPAAPAAPFAPSPRPAAVPPAAPPPTAAPDAPAAPSPAPTAVKPSPRAVDRLRKRLYPTPESCDPTLPYWRRLEELVRPDAVFLDIGAGAATKGTRYDYRGRVATMIGADPDPRVADNPLLDEAHVLEPPEYRLPVPDGSIDVAFCTYVVEHVDDPALFCGEVCRVLKPGGRFLAVTPNKRHYVPLIAAVTPHAFHAFFNRKARGIAEEETFPTRYRMNTPRDFRRALERAGLETERLELLETMPTYLRFSVPTFLIGAAYERAVNATKLFRGLRVSMWGEFVKPGAGARDAAAGGGR